MLIRPTNRSTTDASSLSSFCSRLFFIVLIGAAFIIDLDLFSTNAINSSNGIRNNMPNLPLGDINVVVLTDLHSWVSTVC
jgi:hypothetical protein